MEIMDTNLKILKQRKSLIIIMILLLAIILGVFLVQRPQIFKSKAGNEVFNAFEVKNSNGQILQFTDNPGTRIYQTDDLNVNINVKDINSLIEQ